MSTPGFLPVALFHAGRGLPVVPVDGDGLPLVPAVDATTYDGLLSEWGRRWPGARVGVVRDGCIVAADELDQLKPRQAPESTSSQSAPELPRARVTRMADVEPQPVRWLWPLWVPLGMLTVLDGDPGLGKSTLLLDLIARVSRGHCMPDGSGGGEPGGAVILSAEDDPAAVIRPRLEVAGADLERVAMVHILLGGVWREPVIRTDDLGRIEEGMRRVAARLLVVDPLVAYLPDEVNASRDQDVRHALALLRALAERTGAAVVAVRHLRKTGADNALYRGGGSIGIIAAARAGLLVARDPDDPTGGRRVLAVTKMNLAPVVSSYAFRLVAEPGAPHPRVVWDGPCEHAAQALLAVPADPGAHDELEEAKGFLRSLLTSGPVSVQVVMRGARQAVISEATLRRAKQAEGVVSRKAGRPGDQDQHWVWALPGAEDGREGAHEDAHDERDEHLRSSDGPNRVSDPENPEDAQTGFHEHLRLSTFGSEEPPEGEDDLCSHCGGRVLSWDFGSACTSCHRRLSLAGLEEPGPPGNVEAEGSELRSSGDAHA